MRRGAFLNSSFGQDRPPDAAHRIDCTAPLGMEQSSTAEQRSRPPRCPQRRFIHPQRLPFSFSLHSTPLSLSLFLFLHTNGAGIRAAALCRGKKGGKEKALSEQQKGSDRFTLLLRGILIPPSSTNHRRCQVRVVGRLLPHLEVSSVVFSIAGAPRRDLLLVLLWSTRRVHVASGRR